MAVRSPIVRRLARDLGVDVRQIQATGSDGAITRADVLRAANALEGVMPQASGVRPQASRASGEIVDGLAVAARERLSPMRKAISATLSRSRAEIPEATVWVDVDATELWQARSGMAPRAGALRRSPRSWHGSP
ncbi:E3 binding domain-containing protein [Microbacterium esteraromaticum]|uniref:E3 binding domain-containing protein n=1 Tax=Microbacterium esteraromaticum TaxID=57043 RepID=UPI0031FD5DE8